MLLYGVTEMTYREECDVAARVKGEVTEPARGVPFPLAGPVANNSGRRSGNTPRRAIQRDEATHY
jgi:hypothetical protein